MWHNLLLENVVYVRQIIAKALMLGMQENTKITAKLNDLKSNVDAMTQAMLYQNGVDMDINQDDIKSMFSSEEKARIENAYRRAFEEYKNTRINNQVSVDFNNGFNGETLALGQYSLKDSVDTTKSFAKEVSDIAKGEWDNNNNAVLVNKNSPQWMINAGYNDLPILMTKKHIENAMGIGSKGNQHNVSQNVLSSMPNLLQEPIAVFNYKGNDLLAILKATDNNGNVVVAAIKPNGVGRYTGVEIDTNFLLSAYGKEQVVNFFDKTLNNGNIIYSENGINKKEVLQTILKYQTLDNGYMARPGLQLPDHHLTSSDKIITEDKGNVKYSLEDTNGNKLSEQQSEYFKNSKIRDDDGNLIVVYHGTYEDFNVFDSSKTRANMDIQGNFFSPWKLDAEGYGPNVKAYYLNIKNPASESVAHKALNMFSGKMKLAKRQETI